MAASRRSAPRAEGPGARRDRLQSPLDVEREFWSRGVRALAGLDEVGRGPLAGPVVAAAVVLAPGTEVRGACDSKRLRAGERERLAAEILAAAAAVGVGAASSREVDALNVRRATALAMARALRRLRLEPDHLLVDGLPVPELGLDRQTAVVAGDLHVHSIACASIVAKVCRDRLMRRLSKRYPAYGWGTNMGYGTKEHREALLRLGPTPHHRRSFQPVEQLSLDTEL